MTVLGLVLVLAGVPSQDARMVFPGGSVQIPAGCMAPDLSDRKRGAWLGTITCWPGPSIVVFQRPGNATVCRLSSEGAGHRTQLVSAAGRSLDVCATVRKAGASGTVLREMVVAIGSTVMRAEIREPTDAVTLLFIASTFE